jgi:uncharacterized membrane protein YeaQ/YmgE (transglycosylase-associated protein family)
VVFVLFAVVVALFVVLPLIGLALWAFLSVVVVGLVIGALGRLVVPGSQPIGLVATVLAGLAGSVVGGFIGQHVLDVGRFATILIEIGVAALLVAVLAGPAHRLERTGRP